MSVRPTGADLRKNIVRPTAELDTLYTEEWKVSRSKTSRVMTSLVAVEQYILYLEKKLKHKDSCERSKCTITKESQ